MNTNGRCTTGRGYSLQLASDAGRLWLLSVVRPLSGPVGDGGLIDVVSGEPAAVERSPENESAGCLVPMLEGAKCHDSDSSVAVGEVDSTETAARLGLAWWSDGKRKTLGRGVYGLKGRKRTPSSNRTSSSLNS